MYSIIIPSRSKANLASALGALRGHGIKARVLVAWDEPDDPDDRPNKTEEQAFLDSYHVGGFNVTSFEGEKPFCFARNINRGIRFHQQLNPEGGGVVLMNDDIKLMNPGGLDALVAAAEMESDVYGLVAPLIEGATCCEEQRLDQNYEPEAFMDHVVPVQNHMVPFACVYLTERVLAAGLACHSCAKGPLCEEFHGYVTADGSPATQGNGHLVYGGEDDELCFRLRHAGFRLGIYEKCQVNHQEIPSTFRAKTNSLPVRGARAVFQRIHGFDAGDK